MLVAHPGERASDLLVVAVSPLAPIDRVWSAVSSRRSKSRPGGHRTTVTTSIDPTSAGYVGASGSARRSTAATRPRHADAPATVVRWTGARVRWDYVRWDYVRWDYFTSKRSSIITLSQAATKSRTNVSSASSEE